jgi:hypothetical protein
MGSKYVRNSSCNEAVSIDDHRARRRGIKAEERRGKKAEKDGEERDKIICIFTFLELKYYRFVQGDRDGHSSSTD